jgi:protein SCO1/2
MKGTKSGERRPIAAAIGLAAIAACLAVAGCGSSSGATAASFPGGDAVPAKAPAPLVLTDYRGHRVNLAALKGRAVLVAFLYTHCEDLCPLVAAKVHTAYSLLEPGARPPLFLAVSVDPARDTPASATKFNREHRTAGEIDWLLGSRPRLERVWKAWNVVPHHERRDPEVVEHSADIYGIGADGYVHVLYSPEFKPPRLARGMEALAES